MNKPRAASLLQAREIVDRLQKAHRLEREGKLKEASALVEETRQRCPSSLLRGELITLGVHLRRAQELRALGLAAWVSVPHRDFEQAMSSEVLLVIENVGSQLIHIPARVGGLLQWAFGGTERSQLILEGSYLDRNAYGSTNGASFRQVAYLEEDIVLFPGERWSRRQPFEVVADPVAVEREYAVSASLLAALIEADGVLQAAHAVDFEPASFFIYPRGYEQLADDPLAALARALELAEAQFDPHIAVAARLVGRREARAAVDLLVSALPQADPRRRFAIMTSLRSITGRDFALSEPRWMAWWRSTRPGSQLDDEASSRR
jgi:hypothetical protein